MDYIRFAVRFFFLMVIFMTVGTYGYLVYTNQIPRPDLQGLAEKVAPTLSSGGSVILVVAVLFCCLITAIAPFIYACRSGDGFTVVVSIVALVACFALLFNSRTVIDMVLAAIIYFTSAFISVVMFSTKRIVSELNGKNTRPVVMTATREIAERPFR